jgi:hypothetical protein
MSILSAGLVVIVNGLLTMLGAIASPLTIAGAAGLAALVWLALIEVDELDRQGIKPRVGRH